MLSVLPGNGAAVPKLKALWSSFHSAYDVDVLVVPATPITARPIDDVEPYVAINGRMVLSCTLPCTLTAAHAEPSVK
jgi:Asp-tRNA(Asn)/Glu-tRNA(Gln) amidotransferase A subunit family amidase